MKILFLTIGDETVASTRARVYGYLPFLEKEGIEYRILSFTSKGKCRRILELKKDSAGDRVFETFYKVYITTRLLMLSRNCDIVYVQKAVLPKAVSAILRRLKKSIIFDLDDAITITRDLAYLLKNATGIVVSTPYLKERVSGYNKNIYELISPVRIKELVLPGERSTVKLGWTGSPETSRYLYPLIPVFKKLKERFNDVDIEFMGAKRDNRFDSSGINIIKWSLDGEEGYLRTVDVGIMPLEDNEWSRSKAGYKLLLYMSMGIPCVATPIGINKEILKDGVTGFFANSEDEWFDKLALLFEDKALRKKMGLNGWSRAKELFSYDAVFPRFLKIIKLYTSPGMVSPA